MFNKQIIKRCRAAGILLLTFFLFTCGNPTVEEVRIAPVITRTYETYNFTGLNGNDIYMLKVNRSASTVGAASTGRIASTNYSGAEPISRSSFDADFLPMGHPAATALSANPPAFVDEPPGSRSLSEVPFVAPKVGDKRKFWLEKTFGDANWKEKEATLMATGTHGNIWVVNTNIFQDGDPESNKKITKKLAEDTAELFDLIYPPATKLLGYEYGGGPGGNNGRDRDPKVQILIYDIVNSKNEVVAGGYFWGKDYYLQSQISYSNETEIFYVDTTQVHIPAYMASLLTHELQHMIHWNEKSLKVGNSEAWFNEMLSMMAEDVIVPIITPDNPRHPRIRYMPMFLTNFWNYGVTEWLGDSMSYAKAYAFGAYLMRNFGGAELLQELISNNSSNINAINTALNKMSPGMNFDTALRRYGEAFVYGGDPKWDEFMSFDRTVSYDIGDEIYTAEAINIFAVNRQEPHVSIGGILSTHPGTGPLIFSLVPRGMWQHSVILHSNPAWLNRSGDVSITVEAPLNPDIEIRFLVK